MRQIYLFLAGSMLILSSCSSTQRVSNTPDDVYYSPGGNKAAAASSGDQPEYYSTAPSDQYVRMKSQDYDKWSYFDDYDSYNPSYSPSVSYSVGMGYVPYYGYGYGLGFGGPSFGLGFGDPYMWWNSYYMWNCWYNPYFYSPYYGGGVIVVNPHAPIGTVYNHLRTFNGGGYRTVTAGAGGTRIYRPASNLSSQTYNRGFRNGNPNNYRQTTNTNNTYYRPTYNNNNNQPTRTYSPAPAFNGGGATRGVGGGGGGFSRPGRF